MYWPHPLLLLALGALARLADGRAGTAAPPLMAVLQPRSRHTQGFHPTDVWEMPVLELAQLLPMARLEPRHSVCWVEGADEASAQLAVSRSILTHSLYAIAGCGACMQDALVESRSGPRSRVRVDMATLTVLDMR